MVRRVSENLLELDRAAPPHDRQAELSVIGSVLLVPPVMDDVCLIVKPADFYDQQLATVFQRLSVMNGAGKQIDSTLLVAALKAAKEWHVPPKTEHQPDDGLPRAATLADAMAEVATAAHAEQYAEIVRRHATARSLRAASAQIATLSMQSELEADELVSRAESTVFAIRDQRGTGTESVCSIGGALQDAMAELNSRIEGNDTSGVPTGFTDLDRMISLRRKTLTILAARPSMGKSALALNIAESVARDHGPVLFVSLEMGSVELADRLLSGVAKVDSYRMRNGSVDAEDRRRLVEATTDLSNLPLSVDDSPSHSVIEIAAIARRQKRRGGLSLLVVDYLQLIEPEPSKESREQKVATISKRLKGIARELDIPVLCVAQLNRQAESRSDNKPRLSDLRESGAIEQDADVVMFVHREEYYLPDKQEARGKAEIIVAKQRNGRTGSVQLHWHKEWTTFTNLLASDMPNYEASFDNGGF